MTDRVWTEGSRTKLEGWIAGESRTIVVTREAVETYLGLGPARAAAMTAEDRREFVEDHVALVIAAAARKVDPSDRATDLVTIRGGEL
jgi:hypothetical protein